MHFRCKGSLFFLHSQIYLHFFTKFLDFLHIQKKSSNFAPKLKLGTLYFVKLYIILWLNY